jgi:hypothetical protein
VKCFAAFAKSNNVLMGDHISVADRNNFIAIVQNARLQFQTLLKAAADATNANPRSCSATPQPMNFQNAGPMSAPLPCTTCSSLEVEGDKKKAIDSLVKGCSLIGLQLRCRQ